MAQSPLARLTQSRLALLVALPPTCAAVVWAALLVISAVSGRHPLWDLQPRNLAEAAAFRDGAAVVRLLEQREDINRAGDVRAGVVFPEQAVLSPIEAAAASRQREMVQLVLDLGASPDAAVWQRAFCISDADEVRELLAQHRPPGARDECTEP